MLAVLATSAASLAAEGAPSDKPTLYIVITRDGHRIDAMEKPVVEGARAKVRLAPRGNLALVPADSIDWSATEKYNTPAPPAPAPNSAGASNSPAPEASGLPAAGPSGVREMKILGAKRAVVAAPGDSAVEGEGGTAKVQSAPGAAAAPGASQDPNQTAAQIATLAREMAGLKKIAQDMDESKTRHEEEIAKLQEQVAKQPAASGVQQYESPAQKALARAQDELRQVQDQISKIEARMSEIRSQAVQLGGSVD